MEVGWGLVATAIIYLFGAQLVRLTTGTSGKEVVSNAVLSLRLHFSMFPFLGVLFCIRNAMQSMGQKPAPLMSSCIELCIKSFSAAFLIPRFGFVGTSMTEPVTWVLMVCFLMAVYLRKRKTLITGGDC